MQSFDYSTMTTEELVIHALTNEGTLSPLALELVIRIGQLTEEVEDLHEARQLVHA